MARKPQQRTRRPQPPAWMGFEMQAPDLLGGGANPAVARQAPQSPGQARDVAQAERAYMNQRLAGPMTENTSTVPLETPAAPLDRRVPTGPEGGRPDIMAERQLYNTLAVDRSPRPGAIPADPAGGVADVLRTQFGPGALTRQAATDEQDMMTARRSVPTTPGQTQEIDPRIAASNESFKQGLTNAWEYLDAGLGDVSALGARGLAQGSDALARTLGPFAPELASRMLGVTDTVREAADTAADVGLFTPGRSDWEGRGQPVSMAASPQPAARDAEAAMALMGEGTPALDSAIAAQQGGRDGPRVVRGPGGSSQGGALGGGATVYRGGRQGAPSTNMTGYQAKAFGPILSSLIGADARVQSTEIASAPGKAGPEVQAKATLLDEVEQSWQAALDYAAELPEGERAEVLAAAREQRKRDLELVGGLTNDAIEKMLALTNMMGGR